MLLHLSSRKNSDFVKNRAAEGSVVVDPGVVKGAEECQSGPIRNRCELETVSLELPLSLRFIRCFHGRFSSEGLDHHGPVAAVLGISDAEGEIVGFVWDCSDDLGYGALSSCE